MQKVMAHPRVQAALLASMQKVMAHPRTDCTAGKYSGTVEANMKILRGFPCQAGKYSSQLELMKHLRAKHVLEQSEWAWRISLF